MFDDSKIDAVVKQILGNLPKEYMQIKHDLEKNIKAALSNSFAKMDLVTREEFDVQSALLSRTRAMLDEMQNKVEQLEKKLSDKNSQE